MCDQDSLHVELVLLVDIFRQNEYNDWQIRKALNPSLKVAQPDKKPDCCFPALCQVDIQLLEQGALSAYQVCGPPSQQNI